MKQRSLQILLTGAHRVGKGTTVELLCKTTGYLHTLIDRGFESNYAFARLFDRQLNIDLDQAIHDFFANPSAVIVYFALGANDYETDRAADAPRVDQWVGPPALEYANRDLDRLINSVITTAESYGYSDRILRLYSRDCDPQGQVDTILKWTDSIYGKANY